MKRLAGYLKAARTGGYALGHFNFTTADQLRAIAEAAREQHAPVIAATSRGEADFVGINQAAALVRSWRKEGICVFLNLDHATDPVVIEKAIAAGYDMVHFDGSKLELQENSAITKRVVSLAHSRKVLVEGEVGRIGTDSSQVYEGTFEIKESDLTTVSDAQVYMQETGVDLLAVSVGTFHGIGSTGTDPHLRLDRLRELHEALPATPLVLHGASGTPQEDVTAAITLGICKINVNTDLRIAYTAALRKALADDVKQSTPYKFLEPAVSATRAVVGSLITFFGSAGKA